MDYIRVCSFFDVLFCAWFRFVTDLISRNNIHKIISCTRFIIVFFDLLEA